MTDKDRVYCYAHNCLDSDKPPVGRIAVLLHLVVSPQPLSKAQEGVLEPLAHQLCVQIAANNPQTVHPVVVDGQKPNSDDSTEPALMKQEFLYEDGFTVEGILKQTETKHGFSVDVKHFERWKLGESKSEL